ncbi:MAG: GHKL domain-containing protein [Clostridiales bacterium]|nr:GHKL domain-containing protein [Clostridiales bacterium]
MILQLLAVSVMVFACAKCRKSDALYVAIWSMITAKFFSGIWKIIISIYPIDGIFEGKQELLMIAVYLFCCVVLHFTVAKIMPVDGHYQIGPRQLSLAVGLWIVFEVLYYFILTSVIRADEKHLWLSIALVQCYCVTMLYLLTELFKKGEIEKELLTLNLLRQNQKVQYDLTRENIDLINQKCHDLKHQIAAIREISDTKSREEYLTEIESSIKIYESIVKTGNEVLDTILTEKSLYCNANEIRINCVADGRSLVFINPMDLYAILGNAVDNAIEAVRNFDEPEKRFIDISIYTRNNFLVINITNPLYGKLNMKDEFPETTKIHKGYHGYGLKSIQHNVKKYEGYLDISVRNQCFDLKIAIPLPQENE